MGGVRLVLGDLHLLSCQLPVTSTPNLLPADHSAEKPRRDVGKVRLLQQNSGIWLYRHGLVYCMTTWKLVQTERWPAWGSPWWQDHTWSLWSPRSPSGASLYQLQEWPGMRLTKSRLNLLKGVSCPKASIRGESEHSDFYRPGLLIRFWLTSAHSQMHSVKLKYRP